MNAVPNSCILSELLEYAEREKDFELADRIKQISPVSWKHVNFCGEYTFQDIGDVVDLEQLIHRLVALGQDSATKGGLRGRIPTSETQIDPSGF
jgi:CheY-like chemotaxis protein